MSWIKKEINYLKDSLPQVIKGFFLFILAFSGFACALLLRFFGYNGTIITFWGLVIEGIALFLAYMLLKNFIITKEDTSKQQSIKK